MSKEESSVRSLKRLWPYLRRYRFQMIFGIFCAMATNAAAVVWPEILKDAVNALQAGAKSGYGLFALMILAAVCVQAIFLFLMRRVMIGVSRDIEYELRNDLYKHMQLLSASYYNRMFTGDLMSRNNNDLSAVRMVLGPAIMYSVNTFFTFVFALSMMLRINWVLTLVALSPLPFVSWLVTRYGKVIHRRFKEVQEQFSRISTAVQENLSGIKVVKAFGREEKEIEDFKAANLKYLQMNRQLVKVWGVLYPMVELLAGIGVLIVLWFGGRQVILGHLTLGEFVAFNSYLAMLIWPSIALGWVVNITQRGAASMSRLNEVFEEKPEITDARVSDQMEKHRIRGKIEFRNVSFRYRKDSPVLNNVSFTIRPGNTVAFVGGTGTGKSSLLQLITRMYDPDEGEILIDDIPIQQIPLSILRTQIGFVPQDSFLFSDTLSENIAFGIDSRETHEIEEAARMSAFDEEIESFPKGYETIIGERGITLSGGQKQRATIARALVKDPAILIFDDSFSNVDTYTEDRILQNLRAFRKGRTCLIVAHRISTIQDADSIFLLEHGRIIEHGTHSDLLEKQGAYYQLYQKQLIEEELHIRRIS
ncbi:MAG TPA: ABC transporter ATP-binding protein [Acidobacteriota bacterium]|nr:ABC transporter ATP-binding protein [Acidobacteriota bacterium]